MKKMACPRQLASLVPGFFSVPYHELSFSSHPLAAQRTAPNLVSTSQPFVAAGRWAS